MQMVMRLCLCVRLMARDFMGMCVSLVMLEESSCSYVLAKRADTCYPMSLMQQVQESVSRSDSNHELGMHINSGLLFYCVCVCV